MTETTHLTYLFDPLCGWCYGAAAMIERLIDRDDFDVEIIPTGLFADEGAFAMSDGFAAHAWEADQRIAQLTGQPFAEAYRVNVLGNRNSRVDSGPATLALSAVRLTVPAREFETLHAIQRARYADGRDNGDAATVVEVLDALGLTQAVKRLRAQDAELMATNRARIAEGQQLMRRFAARGVPTLITRDGRDSRMVSTNALYGDFDALTAALKTD